MTIGWPLVLGLLVVFGLLAAGAFALKQKGASPGAAAEPIREGDERNFQKREWLLDHGSEARFYGVLEAALGEKWRVMVQVPLSKLVEPREGLDGRTKQVLRNKIDRKTVDYVVCEAGTLRPRFAVELDGTSHDAARRKERDGFVERVLEGAGVRLVRFDRRGKEWSAQDVVTRFGKDLATEGKLAGVAGPRQK